LNNKKEIIKEKQQQEEITIETIIGVMKIDVMIGGIIKDKEITEQIIKLIKNKKQHNTKRK
jgi:hypothetical protein